MGRLVVLSGAVVPEVVPEVEALVVSDVEALVEADVDALVEALVEADVEAEVEAEVDALVEAEVDAVVVSAGLSSPHPATATTATIIRTAMKSDKNFFMKKSPFKNEFKEFFYCAEYRLKNTRHCV